MASGLSEVAGGQPAAILAAMAAAILFGSVHALMPGHGKMVLASFHLGQPTRLREGVLNGAIFTLTHVGLAVLLVLAGFAVISRAFAYGGRTPQFELASGLLVVLIGAFLLWRSVYSGHHGTGDGKKLAFVAELVLSADYFRHELRFGAGNGRRWPCRCSSNGGGHDLHNRRCGTLRRVCPQ